MTEEYEKLYTEFLIKSIKAEKEKSELQIKLGRINRFNRLVSSIKCPQKKIKVRLTKNRLITVSPSVPIALVGSLLFMLILVYTFF